MKNKWIAIIIAMWLGWMGGHRFYLGKNISGILYLLTCFTFIPTILSIFDIVGLLLTSDEDFDLKYNHSLIKEQFLRNQMIDSPTSPTLKVIPPSDDFSTKIRELDKLRQEGLINNQEFQEQKLRILEASIEESPSKKA